MPNYTIPQPTNIVVGCGTVNEITNVLKDAGYSKPFVTYDKGVKDCGIVDRVTDALKKSGYSFVEFSDVTPDPPADMVDRAADICKKEKCDCVIAIGGGSSIDTAKAVNVLRFNSGKILDYGNPDAVMKLSPGLICIPTTSGTGAELSNGIIITDPVAHVKVPIVGTAGVSEYVILDAELTVGMPAGLTMMTGLDVFSHAMESYTTIFANPVTEIISEKLMADVIEYLPRCVKNGNDIEAREKMLVCASLGGWMLRNCCANVGHSIAHVIGAKFRIPHGAACAFSAPVTIEFLAPTLETKIRKVGEILGVKFAGNEDAETVGRMVADAYRKFRDDLGLKSIETYGITKEQVVTLADDVVNEPFAGFTPRKVTKEAAEELLGKLF